jgi:phosphoglucosamine mutase
MTRKYFGTDGVRGTVGEAPITPEFVLRLGQAAGRVLAPGRGQRGRPAVLIGKDTRSRATCLKRRSRPGFPVPAWT